MMYEILYDQGEERDLIDVFEGTPEELEKHLEKMRAQGCTHLDAAAIPYN